MMVKTTEIGNFDDNKCYVVLKPGATSEDSARQE